MAGLPVRTLKRMLNDSKFSDIMLLSNDGQEFHATTRILQSNCPYFMVARNLEKAVNGKLALDIRGKILAEVRRWIYIKTIDIERFELEDFLDLLSISDSYGMEDLKEKVVDFLNKYPISQENVLKILGRAGQVENQKLTKRCKDYLCQNIPSLLQNPKVFNRIRSNLIIEINQKVTLRKIPNFYLAIGKWAKGRQKALARKVLQETLNLEDTPKEILVDVIKTMLLKDDDIFTEQMIHTLTSEIAKPSTYNDKNLIKLKNIEKIICVGQNKAISRGKFRQILNTEPGKWFQLESCFDYERRQYLEIYFKEPIYVNQLSWKLDFCTTLICVALFEQNGENFWSATVGEETILENTENSTALKLTCENGEKFHPKHCEVILNKTVLIRKIAFDFATRFKINSLFANCIYGNSKQ